MARRRMVCIEIVGDDEFLDMPATSQLLYFHLCVRADDDGFCANYKSVMKLINAHTDDLKILIAKRYVLEAHNQVILIKHWWLHNTIRKDVYKPSTQLRHNPDLYLDENNAYTFEKTNKNYLKIRGIFLGKEEVETPLCYSSVTEPLTERYRKLDKNRLDKIKLDKNIIDKRDDEEEEEDIDTPIIDETNLAIPEKWNAKETSQALKLKIKKENNETLTIDEENFLSAFENYEKELF